MPHDPAVDPGRIVLTCMAADADAAARAAGGCARGPAVAGGGAGAPHQRSPLRAAIFHSGRCGRAHPRPRHSPLHAGRRVPAAGAGFLAAGPQRGRANGRDIQFTAVPDHLVVGPEDLREGANEIAIDFDAGDASLNRNPEFMYTLFVPARARLAFPCFDQPDLKARYTPHPRRFRQGWEALANGAESARQERGDRSTLTFAETPPLPTYLFAFAAGRFQVETAERNGRRFRMFHRETDAAKVARNRDAIFDLHAARSNGSSATPASPTRSASSISCWCRRSSSAAWSTPARFSTTPRGCCSISRRRRTSSSAAPASSRTRPRTCGSATWSRCGGSTMSG